MKTIISFTILFVVFVTITFGQSVMDYQSGTTIEVRPGADVCADDININGTYLGGGTICGSTAYVLNLMAYIQGFYDPSSNTMVGDTATVYLRNIVSPFAIVDQKINTLNSSGIGTFIFSNAANAANYYIVLKHRNSIETWSKVGNAFATGFMFYDFSTAANKAYGDNQAQINASPVRFGIFSGDENQDGSVDVSDIINVYNDGINFVSGYVSTDMNGDDFVDVADLIITYNNSINFVSVIRP